MRDMKTFTAPELAECDGREGRPAYIAFRGKVYDVSESRLWAGGRHMRRHDAGSDLTAEIQAAPHEADVLGRCPQVGVLEEAPAETRPMPGWLAWLMETNPFFRRHPHPMTVHFPIVFMLAHPVFNTLFLLTGNRAFETTAFHCLGGGVLFTTVAMLTGFLTWWYNYMARMMRPVAVKIALSVVTLVLGAVAFVWRWQVPDVMNLQGSSALYYVVSLAFVPLIAVVGWYGATLTFPLEAD